MPRFFCKPGRAGLLRNFLGECRGAVYIWVAACMAAIVGMASLGVDMSYHYQLRSQLQHTADAAALAAVRRPADQIETQSVDETEVQNRAIEYAGKNMPTAAHGAVLATSDVQIGGWKSGTRSFEVGGTPTNAVRVIARRAAVNDNAAPGFFSRVLGVDSVDISTVAVASIPAPACLLALDPNANKALEVSSGSTLNAAGCAVHVNSNDPEALSVTSDSHVVADSVCVHGEANVSSGSDVDPDPEEGCSPLIDPLAGLPGPSYSGTVHTDYKLNDGETWTVSPGIYRNGLIIENGSTGELQPGNYIIEDGPLYVASGATIEGSGVHFYLMGDLATVEIESGSYATLSAPDSGPQAGMLFHQDPNAEPGGDSFVASGSQNDYEGVMYFPTQNLSVQSNSSSASSAPWTMIIANTVRFQSGSGVDLNIAFASSTVPVPSALVNRPALVY